MEARVAYLEKELVTTLEVIYKIQKELLELMEWQEKYDKEWGEL